MRDIAYTLSDVAGRRTRCCLAALCALAGLAPWGGAQAVQSYDHDIKVAFLYNAVKFVEWPQPLRAGVPLRLCVLGAGPFAEAAAVLRGKPVEQTVWEVVPAGPKSNLRECGVLLISASEAGSLGQALNGVKGGAVLTVGDSDGYAEQGVILNFYPEQNKVRFEVNLEAAKRAGLRISSQLLKLARIVGDRGAP